MDFNILLLLFILNVAAWNYCHGHTRKGLGYAFTRKACFVSGSFSHLIRDCDFHEERITQAELTKRKNKAHDRELADYQEFKGGSIAFGGSNGRIIGKEKIKTGRDKIEKNIGFKTCEKPVSQVEHVFLEELEKLKRKENEANDAAESLRKEAAYDIKNASTSSTNLINTASTPLSTAGPSRAFNDGELSYPDPSKYALPGDPSMPYLEDIYASPSEGIFTDSSYDDKGLVTDFSNLETTMRVSPTPITRIHTIHPKT
nr:hypothetical protein [Tanacetum cinerariifolium]